MTNRVVAPARHVGNRFLGSLKGLQIRTLVLLRLRSILKLGDTVTCSNVHIGRSAFGINWFVTKTGSGLIFSQKNIGRTLLKHVY